MKSGAARIPRSIPLPVDRDKAMYNVLVPVCHTLCMENLIQEFSYSEDGYVEAPTPELSPSVGHERLVRAL